MKIKEAANQEIVLGGGKEMVFSIDDSNPIIFDILRNKMYSNKIGAIAREVSSNARDANREAGLGDQPIDLEITAADKIFNMGDTCIIFRDYGLGITPDRMENIFVKYAASTKRDSNAQTGGFGLGAKTPFAYTDSFIVRTTCDYAEPVYKEEQVKETLTSAEYEELANSNTKFITLSGKDSEEIVVLYNKIEVDYYKPSERKEYIYNAIIDKTGKGKMILLSDIPTKEVTGTEIYVPIKSKEDRMTFEKECLKATFAWEHVNYIGFEMGRPDVEVLHETEGFKIIKSSNIFSGHTVHYIGLIDGIPYPVFPTKMSGGIGSVDYQVMFEMDLDAVTINANRESLQIDEVTEKFLENKIKEIEEYLENLVDNYCSKHDSYFHALRKKALFTRTNHFYTYLLTEEEKFIRNLSKTGYETFLNDYSFKVTYKGEPLKPKLGLKYHYINKAENTELDMEGDVVLFSKFIYKKLEKFTYANSKLPLYYFDAKQHSSLKNLKIIEQEHSSVFILIKPTKGATESEIKEDLDYLKSIDIDYKLYSQVQASKKKTVKNKTKKGTIAISVRDTAGGTMPYLTLDLDTKELLEFNSPLDVETTAFHCVSNLYDAKHFRRTEEGQMLGLVKGIKGVVDIFIVNEKMYEKRLKPLGFKKIKEFYEEIDTEELEKIFELELLDNLFDKIPKYLVENFIEILPKSTKKLLEKRGILRKFVEDKGYNIGGYIPWDTLRVKPPLFDYEGLIKKTNMVLDYKYPLLKPYLREADVYNVSFYGVSNNISSMSSKLKEGRIKRNIKNYLKHL